MTLNDQAIIDKYSRLLLRPFINQTMPAKLFEQAFLTYFKNEPTGLMSDDVFHVLDTLFYYVDAYWEECTADEGTPDGLDYCITEATLRNYAKQALDALQALKAV